MNKKLKSKVKPYTDRELLDRVKTLKSFKHIPKGYWILGVQSNEDTYNEFDDKFYLYKGEQFITMAVGTTNAGLTGLMNYNRYNRNGCAVIKTGEWYYKLWSYGLHRGKMPALRQVNPIKYYRDNNRDKHADQTGKLHSGLIGINFHTVTYRKDPGFWRKLIGGWSVGCQVINSVDKYYTILRKVKWQPTVSYCLIKEF